MRDVSDRREPASFDVRDSSISKAVSLTNADVRFIDRIVQVVLETVRGFYVYKQWPHDPRVQGDAAEPDSWLGSSAWVRQQFHQYLTRFLATVRFYEMMHDPKYLDKVDGLHALHGAHFSM